MKHQKLSLHEIWAHLKHKMLRKKKNSESEYPDEEN